MFFNLVYRNAKRSQKENLIYFGTLVTAVASFYMILSLERQDVILYLKDFESDAIEKLFTMMPILYLFALFLLFFLVLFANRYQLERRSKEFGMYLMLGMRQKNMFFLLISEGVITSLLALLLGVGIGSLVAEILSLTTARLIGQGIIGHQLSFSFQAVLYTVVGFLLIQVLALLILAGKLFNRELQTLLKGQVDKKQAMGKAPANWVTLISGVITLGIAYWLILTYFKLVNVPMIFLAVVLGIFGTVSLIRGLTRLLNSLAFRSEKTTGLTTFTLRQLQENIANRSMAVAVSSLLMMLSLIMLAEGAGTILSSTDKLRREHSIYDVTVQGPYNEIENFLTSADMAPYVANLNPLELGRMQQIETNDDVPQSLLDWSNLREEIVGNLPEGVTDPAIAHPEHTTVSPELSEAENLLGTLDYRMGDYLIRESDYNRLLEAANEEPIHLAENEMALYFNPDFGDSRRPLLQKLIVDSQLNQDAPIMVQDKTFYLIPDLPLKGIVTDRSISVSNALIVTDAFFESYTNPNTREVYWNFTIPEALTAEDGLMLPIKEASDLLSTTGFQFETYLQNFGRQLFYIVAGSYTMLYLAFLFLVIGCTVLALQYLTQLKQTKARYRTLSFLGAKREQINASIKKQIMWYFLFPLVPALVSGVVGIITMQSYFSFNTDFLPGIMGMLPFILLMIGLFLLVQWVYAVAVYRTSVNEINQRQFK